MKKFVLVIIIVFIGLVTIPNIFGDQDVDERGWTKTEVVSTESSGAAYRAILDVDQNGTVHIAWLDNTNYSNSGPDWDIFYKKKPRDGNWTTTEVVSTESTDDSNCPSLDVDQNGTVHIAWKDKTNYDYSGEDYDIFYKKKSKDGNWTLTEVVTFESVEDCGCPSLTVDTNYTVHVAWPEATDVIGFSSDYDIFYKKKPKDGSWTLAEQVSPENKRDSSKTSVAVDPFDTVHVVWEEVTDFGYYGIFYRYKPRGGNWTEVELVTTESTSDALSPFLVADNWGTLHVAWVDGTDYLGSGGNDNICYKKKPLNGNWTSTEVVSTENKNNCIWPSVAVDQNQTVHIVWSEKPDIIGKIGNYEIFYKKKPKDKNWTQAELVSSESKSNSYFTSIAVDIDGRVHVSWWDDPFGKAVVYYKEKIPEYDQSPVDDGEPDDTPVPPDDGPTITPGFEFVFVICSVVIVYLLQRRRYF